MSNDDYELGGDKLYHRDGIRIHSSVRGEEEHDVVVGDNYFLLGRGILKQMSESSVFEIERIYRTVRGVDWWAENPKITLPEFALAVAQARNSELEKELSSAYQNISELR